MASEMSRNTAVLLFTGQGAQTIGMGRDLADHFPIAAKRFEQANQQLGFDLSEVMFKGPADELTRTSRCQPALFVHGMVCLEILRDLVPDLEIVGAAGLSLGEFTAHAAAGTFSFEDGLDVVAKRGQFMEEATKATEGTMAALIGGEEEQIVELATHCNIDVANFNAPGQIVVSGSVDGVNKAVEKAEEFGVRIAKVLDVAGAYHSRLMVAAQDKLAPELAALDIKPPKVPVICNVDAAVVSTPEDIRSTLVRQVSGSVRWGNSMEKFIADGDTTFIEIGPGRVLIGLMKRINRKVKMHTIHDVESIQQLAENLNNQEMASV